MDNRSYGTLRMNGSGSSGGGIFDKVVINGSGKINGDVECDVFHLNGTGHVEGNLKTTEGRISGSGVVDGNLTAATFRITGSGRIGGAVNADELTISGSGNIGNNVQAQNVRIEGSAKIGQDCNAEVFTSDGAFEIGGLLNADDVTIRLFGMKSKAREIGGGRITVALGPQRGLGVLKTIVSMGILNPVLEADVIEGDEISLENTTARIVRGNNVVIGAGCDIGTVEYKGQYTRLPEAKVGTETKV
jgi:cytoskeletal protein CcmA (bactofilin family)